MYAAMVVRPMNKKYVGRKCGVLNLTREGKCPTCGSRVERSYTDIFFPYCGYSCKRVEQRAEESRMKQKIIDQQNRYNAFVEREKERKKRLQQEAEEKRQFEQIESRLAQCVTKYEHYKAIEESLPRKCKKRRNVSSQTRKWRKKMAEARRVFDEAMRLKEEGKGINGSL